MLDKYPNLGRVILFSMGFQLLFVAYNSTENQAAKAMDDDGFQSLGFYSMSTLYFVFAIFSFLSTAIVNKIGVKSSLFIGALTYAFRQMCFIFPAYYSQYPAQREKTLVLSTPFIYTMVLLSAAINGMGAGILWTSQGRYISQCATDATKGFFFSVYFIFFQSSQVTGNLMGGLLLDVGSQATYSIAMTAISFLAAFTFLMLKAPLPGKPLADVQHNATDSSYNAVEYAESDS